MSPASYFGALLDVAFQVEAKAAGFSEVQVLETSRLAAIPAGREGLSLIVVKTAIAVFATMSSK
jgi:hypothetical protein